jgi:hypothetical protein
MLPTAHVSPYADAERKVALIEPQGKRILDTCGGLGYFAAFCMRGQAKEIASYEKSADVLWLRSLNPWSPSTAPPLTLTNADAVVAIAALPRDSFDAALHDPPRFGIAGELYSQSFYGELARVLRRGAPLFHYTGSPNSVSAGRDLADEVSQRLGVAGFTTERSGDGVLAKKRWPSVATVSKGGALAVVTLAEIGNRVVAWRHRTASAQASPSDCQWHGTCSPIAALSRRGARQCPCEDGTATR